MNVLAIIPARYASSRFPGKPLIDIKGTSMIQRVYEQATKAASLQKVVIATDDQRIVDHATSFGAEVIMTSEMHETGTDRCAEAYSSQKGEFDIVLNIQGDEPFIEPEQIDLLINFFAENFKEFDVATLNKKIEDIDVLLNPSIIKVVKGINNKALYFSRSPIPFVRGVNQAEWLQHQVFYKHIGLYAFKANQLELLSSLDKSSLEISERLEQLRWMQNGYSIGIVETNKETISIDTPEDLKKV